jgi:cytochrome c-type biogenesis protein
MGELLGAFGNAFSASALLALPAALAWGVLSVVLSPCHLSSVPLVVAYMNGGSEPATGARALGLSSSFAAGILASIALIGGITAAAGRMLGDVGRAGTWVLAGVFLLVGLNLLGVLPLPTWAAPAGKASRRGATGALLLGTVFGAALGPCTFAFMAPLLAIALRAGATEVGYGALLVAVFGIGHALAIAVAGSSFQGVQRWLGSRWGGRAVAVLRTGAGLAVLAGGAYFVYTAI